MSVTHPLIEKANERLLSECGQRPTIRWIHTRSSNLQWPTVVFEQKFDGSEAPVLDYHCVCGVNVRDHRPDCAGSVGITRVVMRHYFEIMPSCNRLNGKQIDAGVAGRYLQNPMWILCRSFLHTDEDWKTQYGTAPHAGELWCPLPVEPYGYFAVTTAEAAHKVTPAFIDMLRVQRRLDPAEFTRRALAAQERAREQGISRTTDRIVDLQPVRRSPGKVDGPVSLPTVGARVTQTRGNSGMVEGSVSNGNG